MSTSIQLFAQLKLLQDAFENRVDIYNLYLDFSKALDRVRHQILLKRTFVIGGNLFKLLSSYLQNRKKRVIVNDYVSELEKIRLESRKVQFWDLYYSLVP